MNKEKRRQRARLREKENNQLRSKRKPHELRTGHIGAVTPGIKRDDRTYEEIGRDAVKGVRNRISKAIKRMQGRNK